MRPIPIPKSITRFIDGTSSIETLTQNARMAYSAITSDHPEVSIIIPAYNEAANIVPTLASLCQNSTIKKVEIVVVNNNSQDNTQSLAEACGVTSILETKQGITFARNAGLAKASGKYILNADADTIYPEHWIDEMVNPLIEDDRVAITYGRFSFIPVGNTGRITYFFYEYLSDLTKWFNKKTKDEAVNVYGFNSSFRREQGLAVDGFNHPPNANEDGYLALKLREAGFGRLHYVTSSKALVWTTDRRIQIDGGLVKGIFKRLKRVLRSQ